MIRFLFILEGRGREEAKHNAVHSLRPLTCLQPTYTRVQFAGNSERVTRSRIRGPAVTFPVTARFRCRFSAHVRYPEQWKPSSMKGRGRELHWQFGEGKGDTCREARSVYREVWSQMKIRASHAKVLAQMFNIYALQTQE
jgi:hypothetical protein